MKWLSTIFLALFTLSGFSQPELKEAMGLQSSNPDSAIVLASAIAEKTHDAKLKGNAWEVIGNANWVKENYMEAIFAHEKALELRSHQGEEWKMAYSYNNLGLNYAKLGDYEKANDLYLKGLDISERYADTTNMIATTGNIGIVFEEIGHPEKALTYYLSTLEMLKNYPNDRIEANTLHNIALVYKQLDRMEDAIAHAEASLSKREEIGDSLGIAQSLNLIGNIHSERNDHSKADSCFQLALTIYDRRGNIDGNAMVLGNLGQNLLNFNQTQQALDYCERSYQLSVKNNLRWKESACKCMAEAYGDLKMFDESEVFWKRTLELKDSIQDANHAAEIVRRNSLHEFELEQYKRQQEAERLQREAEFFERRDRILHYSAILIFMSAFFWLMLYLSRKKVNAKLLSGSVFFFFLITFEFTLMLIDPMVSQASDNLPIFKLMMNATIALLFIPLNEFLEKRLKKKLIGTTT